MKKRLSVFMLVILILIVFGQISGVTDIKKIDAKIRRAADYWLNPKPGEDSKDGVKVLLEAIVMAAPDTEFPAEFGKKISEAKKIFDSSSVFNQKGIALLKDAYLLINAGKKYMMPGGLSNVKRALEYTRKQIDAARKDLKQGKTGQCAKILLEVVLVAVTPME